MNDGEEKSNTKFFLIGIVAVAVIGFGIWAKRTYQTPMRITPKEGHLLAEKFGKDKMDSVTVAPLPDADDSPQAGTNNANIAPRKNVTSQTILTPEQYAQSTNHWITGRVALKGAPPAEKPLPLDPECQADAKANNLPPAMTRNFVVGTNGGLADVVVTLLNGPGEMPGHILEPLTIHIRGCQIQPYVSAAVAGQIVRIKSHDSEFYDMKGFPTNIPNAMIDFAIIPGAPPPEVAFTNPEEFMRIFTEKRRWIKGFLTVVTHPFVSVTDTNGQFRIPLPPVANAEVKIHHPLLPPLTKTVKLREKTDASAEFVLEYQPPKETAK